MLKDKDLKEIQGLISVGKERGYVTYEEMNNVLPTHLVSDDQLDDVLLQDGVEQNDHTGDGQAQQLRLDVVLEVLLANLLLFRPKLVDLIPRHILAVLVLTEALQDL